MSDSVPPPFRGVLPPQPWVPQRRHTWGEHAPLPSLRPVSPAPQGQSPRRRSTGRRVLVLFARLALVVVVVMLKIYAFGDRGPDHPDSWDPRVLPLVEFVESERGKSFDHPVYVRFLDEAAYRDRIVGEPEASDDGEPGAASADTGVAAMRALGLLSGEIDVEEVAADMVSDGSAAFYDEYTDEIIVKGTEFDVGTRVTTVHELTHALQDQVIDLTDRDGESSDHRDAIRALIEGDASAVESAYVNTLGQAELAEYQGVNASEADAAQTQLSAGGVPDSVQAAFALPYFFGEPFIEAVLNEGGTSALWELLMTKSPKGTLAMWDLTADPELVPVSPAAPEGPSVTGDGRQEVEVDTSGVLSWAVPLAEYTDHTSTLSALAGWRGDKTVVTSDAEGGAVCVDATLAFSDEASAVEFERVAATWIAALPPEAGASATHDGDLVRFHSCDPGPEVQVPVTGAALRNLTVLAVRNSIAAEMVAESGESIESGLCFADGLIQEYGVDAVVTGEGVDQSPEVMGPRLAPVMLSCGLLPD